MFKQLTTEEEVLFRKWARDNYKVCSDISGMWHPVVADECVKMNSEGIEPKKPAVVEKVVYSAGQFFTDKGGDVYMLAQVGKCIVSLITVKEGNSLTDVGSSWAAVGNRWADPVPVKNAYKISQVEFEKIASEDDFKLVKVSVVVSE